MLPDVRAAHGRLVLFLGAALALLWVIGLAASLLILRGYQRAVPSLRPDDPVAEALRWPWNDFPPVTEIERSTIRSEIGTVEPLVQGRMVLWLDDAALEPGLFGFRDGAARAQFRAALEPFASIRPGGRESPGAEQIERAILRLSEADALQPKSWPILYNRGVLAAWRGKWQAAVEDLTQSQTVLNLRLYALSNIEIESADTRNAVVLTAYALGSAWHGLADSSTLPVERSTAFHAAIAAYQVAQGYAAREASGALSPGTGELPVSAIQSDLLAAYLKATGFHRCPAPPERAPACGEQGIFGSACVDRDSSFCQGRKNAADTDPLSRRYLELYHRFYRGDKSAWNRENDLWAMALALGLDPDVSRLRDPALLANLGLLSAQVGELELALSYLEASLAHAERPEDRTRILRLITAYGALTEKPFLRAAEDRGEASPARKAFLDFYSTDPAALRLQFPAVLADETQALFDRWLFIRFWRSLLAHGEFERFTREYDRLMREDELFKDFFARWHEEVLGDLGQRALGIASDLEDAGEHDRAHSIRTFLSDTAHFPPAVRAAARTAGGGQGWIGWAARRSWPWLAIPALLLVMVMATIYCLGLIRLHRTIFFSFHRLERKGAREAYSAQASGE